jgi:hypothetical protein
MTSLEDGFPPDSIEQMNLTREVRALFDTEKFQVEEHTYIELTRQRMVILSRGSIPGTLELLGNHNWPEEHLGPEQWAIVLMGRVTEQLYPLRFRGDEQQCLADLLLLRLATL